MSDEDSGPTVSEGIMFFWKIMFMIVAVFIIVLLISFFTRTTLETKQVEAEVLFYKIMYTTNGINAVDPITGTTHHAIIDIERLKMLDQLIIYPKERYASAKLTVFDESMRQAFPPYYYSEIWYKRWLPLVGAMLKGPEGADEFVKTVPIIYKENQEVKQGFMEVSIIIPRSR